MDNMNGVQNDMNKSMRGIKTSALILSPEEKPVTSFFEEPI